LSRHAAIELDWGDGTYTFRLGLEEIEELERKRDCSVFELARRMSPQVASPRSGDILDTIRLGLIGGGMAPVAALGKVRHYGERRPLHESRLVAFAVLLAAIERVQTEDIEAVLSGNDEAFEPMRLNFAEIIVSAARMGIMQPMLLSLGQWAAAVRVWNQTQGGTVSPPTDGEFEAAVARASGA